MELVQSLEAAGEESPLARARLHRQLTVEETARRAGISPDEVRWLEEGRVYRFPTPDDALLAVVLYAAGLGIGTAEARRLAGFAAAPTILRRSPLARVLVLAGVFAVLGIVLAAFFVPRGGGSGQAAARGPALPPPWRVPVTVLNGSGDMIYTRHVADRVLSFAYRIQKVGRADRFDYPQTAVFFPPGCEGVGLRLAKQLGVATKPLPGGGGPCALFVIVGPARGPGE